MDEKHRNKNSLDKNVYKTFPEALTKRKVWIWYIKEARDLTACITNVGNAFNNLIIALY